jgi:hypothetical protein
MQGDEIMSTKAKQSVFDRKSPDAKPIDQILKPSSKADRDAAYAAGKAKMDAAMVLHRREKVAA